MGLYYKQKVAKNTNTASIVMLSIVGLVLLLLILPFTKPVATFLYGIFGLAIFFYLMLLSLIAVAKLKGRRFYMSVKNIVYLALSFVSILGLFHSAFLGAVLRNLGGVKFSNFGRALQVIMQGTAGVTVGGIIATFFSYPLVVALGKVGASLTFGIIATIFVGFTVDYYVNLKSVYDKQRIRREVYKNATPLPAEDTIEGNLTILNNIGDVAPKKEDSVEYNPYFDPTITDEQEVDTDTIVETGEPAFGDINEEEDEQDDFNKRFFANTTLINRDEDNLSNDERATSKYDPEKFSSPEEYIKTKYVPKIFLNRENDKTDDEPKYTFDTTFTPASEEQEAEEESDLVMGDGKASKSPFVFVPLENNFNTSDRISLFEEKERRIEPIQNDVDTFSPFVGYTPSDTNKATQESSDRLSSRLTDRIERQQREVGSIDISNNNPLTSLPKKEPRQIEIEGARAKPKKYPQEQDDKYNPPTTALLESRPDDPSSYGSDYEEKSRALESILSSFKIDAKVIDVTRGPSVTQYELAMPFGISVKRVLQYDGDISAALRSKNGVRIEAPIAGKNAVGVEVPNDTPSTVGLRELLESNEFKNTKAILPFVVGKNIYGETIIKSLPKMVHMLVAGSTGSGKSVFLHSILLSLMYKCSPSQLRFILIDPKRVEFTIYSGMPHMMLPNAVSNCEKAINALGWAVKEMERRFDTFQTLSVQNIEDYNHCEQVKNGEYPKIPYVVIVIDELNELMMTGKKEVEEKITRLSQLGRASGIHMIIATQRPSADVVTGTIKNNLPTRVAFSLQSGIDSRVILDEVGAEKLLGRGDMLLAAYDDKITRRMQGSFMSMDEVRKVVRYIKDHNESYFDEAVAKEILADKPQPQVEPGSSIAGNLEPDEDELLPVALKLCIDSGGASINMVQRRFKVGYARAARIIDQMELAGYISPGNGSKLRTVYMTIDEYHEKFGEDY